MASIDIISNNNTFFEGAEKLLEIWFTRKDGNIRNCDLRNIPRDCLRELLDVVKCSIISFNQNEMIDSYVLSESSMFVSQRRFLLKTCGTTTLLNCVKPLIKLVKTYTMFDDIEDMYYSRKNFMHPELQNPPHTSFDLETEVLNNWFRDGASYCLGRMNQDCWYLFTPNSFPGSVCKRQGHLEPDQTFEMLMTELDPEIMKIFTKEVCSDAPEATKKSGIDKILPRMEISDYLFNPCGYSMNGIRDDGSYMTIHITPEPECSYVSFETNAPQNSYRELMRRVLNTFRPGKCIITLLANETSTAATAGQKELQDFSEYRDYQQLDMQYSKLKNYHLTYALYTKFPS